MRCVARYTAANDQGRTRAHDSLPERGYSSAVKLFASISHSLDSEISLMVLKRDVLILIYYMSNGLTLKILNIILRNF